MPRVLTFPRHPTVASELEELAALGQRLEEAYERWATRIDASTSAGEAWGDAFARASAGLAGMRAALALHDREH